ncbi:MAG: DUF2281 domain-containing protein [Saprospiraceae bacterium]
MSTLTLYSKFETLPEHLQQQVIDYIEFLLSREAKKPKPQKPAKAPAKPKAGFGGAKGMIKLSPDWDEPLEDFKDYVSAAKKPLKAGFLKGSFVMAADFDEPLKKGWPS